MLYQVNYKYVSDSNKLRSAACVVEAPDVKAANKLAAIEIKKEFDHFQITSTKQFGKPEEKKGAGLHGRPHPDTWDGVSPHSYIK